MRRLLSRFVPKRCSCTPVDSKLPLHETACGSSVRSADVVLNFCLHKRRVTCIFVELGRLRFWHNGERLVVMWKWTACNCDSQWSNSEEHSALRGMELVYAATVCTMRKERSPKIAAANTVAVTQTFKIALGLKNALEWMQVVINEVGYIFNWELIITCLLPHAFIRANYDGVSDD